MILPSIESFGSDTAFERGLLFEEIESDFPNERKVLSSKASTDPTKVFSESEIQNPMQPVFNTPMRAHSSSDGLSIVCWQRGRAYQNFCVRLSESDGKSFFKM